MAIQTQPLELSDFSGGLTDEYIDCAPNKYYTADNFFITANKKLFTRFGSRIYDLTSPRVPDGFTRVSALLELSKSLLCQSRRKFYIHDTAWTAISGSTGNPVLSTGSDTDYVSTSEWNDHLFVTSTAFPTPVKIFKDVAWKAVTSGLPALASSPTPAGTAGANNYIYAFHYTYDYTANTVQYEDVGPITFVNALALNAPNVNNITLSSIPVLVNGATGNYDLATTKVEIYRTTNAGVTFYKVGEVLNGVTSFVDSFSDATIALNQVIYTAGGGLDRDPPPLSKYVHIVSDIGYYANIKDGTQLIKDRIRLSVPGNPSACPVGFFLDTGSEIMGLSSADTIPLVFCTKSIFRIEGFFDELGRGNPNLQRVSSTVGCVSNQSIVKVPGGCFFAGQDGFYFTDGYKEVKVTSDIDDRYKTLVENEAQRQKIYGTYDPSENRVYFSVLSNAGSSTDNDVLYVCDLNFGISETMPFTTYSNGTDFSPTAIVFFNKNLIRGDRRGFIFEHAKGEQSDLIVNTNIDPSLWDKKTIIWLYEGPATSFGTNMVRKWVTRVSILAKNESNTSIQITSINDDFKSIKDLSLIRFRGNVTWGDPDITWGDADVIWNYNGVVSEIRHFPKNGLRCTLKQLRISNGFSIVANSDVNGTGTVVIVPDGPDFINYVNLDVVTNAWPLYAKGYKIYFEDDNYTRGYDIDVRGDLQIEILDPELLLTPGSKKWIMQGYAKNEVLNLISYTLHYAPLGQTQTPFIAANLGGNAT